MVSKESKSCPRSNVPSSLSGFLPDSTSWIYFMEIFREALAVLVPGPMHEMKRVPLDH